MQFEIVRAVPKDAEALYKIMETVTAGMEHSEWFVSDDLSYIQNHIGSEPIKKSNKGFVLKAIAAADNMTVGNVENSADTREEIAGFLMVDFPGIDAHNLGTYLSMSDAQLAKVAHMDSVVILPKYRGNGLQHKLMETAERIIKKETDYRILLATVHPENVYSLRNATDRGFRAAKEVTAYGTYQRYVMIKEIV